MRKRKVDGTKGCAKSELIVLHDLRVLGRACPGADMQASALACKVWLAGFCLQGFVGCNAHNCRVLSGPALPLKARKSPIAAQEACRLLTCREFCFQTLRRSPVEDLLAGFCLQGFAGPRGLPPSSGSFLASREGGV